MIHQQSVIHLTLIFLFAAEVSCYKKTNEPESSSRDQQNGKHFDDRSLHVEDVDSNVKTAAKFASQLAQKEAMNGRASGISFTPPIPAANLETLRQRSPEIQEIARKLQSKNAADIRLAYLMIQGGDVPSNSNRARAETQSFYSTVLPFVIRHGDSQSKQMINNLITAVAQSSVTMGSEAKMLMSSLTDLGLAEQNESVKQIWDTPSERLIDWWHGSSLFHKLNVATEGRLPESRKSDIPKLKP